jgi:hypothetical protein
MMRQLAGKTGGIYKDMPFYFIPANLAWSLDPSVGLHELLGP